MTQPLVFDAETVRSTASTLIEAGSRVPTIAPVELASCGSTSVAAAAARFNDRAGRYAVLLGLQLVDVGNGASSAADAWQTQDAALATGASS